MDDWEMARLGIRAVRTMARFAEQQQRMRERELRQTAKDGATRSPKPRQQARPALPAGDGDDTEPGIPVCQPEFTMPVNADGEIPDEFLPRI